MPNAGKQSRDHQRRMVRLVLAGAAAAGVVLGVVGLPFQGAPSAPPAATAQATGGSVAAVPGKILHVAVSATETSGSGVSTSWSDDSWLGYPNGAGSVRGVSGFRQVVRHSGISVQTGVYGRGLYSGTDNYQFPGAELYDAAMNTIYELPPVSQRSPLGGATSGLASCSQAGPGVLYLGEPATLIGAPRGGNLMRAEANDLAGGVYLGGPSGKPFFSSLKTLIPNLWSPCTAAELASNVRAGSARLVGSESIDGRRVIEFRAANGSWTYYAEAQSGKPVRLVVRGIDALAWPQGRPTNRERATLTFNVRTYEQLPFRGHEKLLSLTAQHHGARIDTNTADYYAAEARLFPRRSWG